MVPDSPADALGPLSKIARDIVVDVARTRHGYAADAHKAAHTRSTHGYSTLWHDLLIDVQEAFREQQCELYRLTPAGHRVPIVNGCIVYVWRIPASGDPAHFAKSPTKMSCFNAQAPDPGLFEAAFMSAQDHDDSESDIDLAEVMTSIDGNMPVVLVMLDSSPDQLKAIDWAIAELDPGSGEVRLRGHETIWQPEPVVESGATGFEPFDSGTPLPPAIEPRKQEETDPDA